MSTDTTENLWTAADLPYTLYSVQILCVAGVINNPLVGATINGPAFVGSAEVAAVLNAMRVAKPQVVFNLPEAKDC